MNTINCESFDSTIYTGASPAPDMNRIVFSSLHHICMEDKTSPTYSIKYCLKGTECYYLNKRKFAVGRGRFLIVNRDNPFSFFIESQRAVQGLCFHLEHSFLYDVFLQSSKTEEWLLDHPFEATAPIWFDELLSSNAECELGRYLQVIESRLHAPTGSIALEEEVVFYELARRLLVSSKVTGNKEVRLNVQRNSTKKEILKRLSFARELVEQNQDSLVDIASLSLKANLSASHFFRCFKQAFGMTPYQYQLRLKMKKAKNLLAEKKLSITEISFACGFSDLASFSKAFKKQYNLSPQRFQKSC